jgi:transcriptional regulator GlxA family with amidase domain
MKLAFVIFDNMTALDFIGLYDPLTRLKSMGFMPELSWDICAFTETVTDDRGLKFTPSKCQPPFEGYDWLVVSGGNGTRKLQHDEAIIAWLQTARDCPLKVSVCTGSLLLGAAGYLQGKAATTHPNSFEALKPYCAEVLDQRVVESGDVITGRGVTSAIDLGLYLCEKVTGEAVTDQIRTQMDYPYRWQVASSL